jgi:rod shape determining protein RodA
MIETTGRKGHFEFSLFFAIILLWVIGIFLVYSATHVHTGGPLSGLFKTQIIWVAMGILIILAVVSVPTRIYYSLSYVIYGFSLLLLLYALFGGVVLKGAGRWISIGGFHIQPSEFAKIGLLFALAYYLSRKTISLERISSLIIPGMLILVPFLLVLQQPDLGTALVFCVISFPMFYWAGMSLLEIFFVISPAISIVLSAIPLIITYGSTQPLGIVHAIPWGIFFVAICSTLYFIRPRIFILVSVIIANLVAATITTVLWNSFLKDYQKARIISFINPQADPFGAGYQVIQSKVAIGSGHLFGKGYLQGTQTRLSYLPEQHTDFIFSVLGEQFGLVGCMMVLLLFLFIIIRGLTTIHSIRNRFTNLIIIGSVSIISFHIFVNIAMVIGIMPVTGLPLPFLSYGGSFTLTVAFLMGLILNAKISNQDF